MSTVSELPSALRAAATARRLLGQRGTRAVYGSPFAGSIRRLLTAAAPEECTLVTICGGANAGARMYADLSCEKYYWLGTHEEHVQRALLARTRPGDVAYDIGAHAGFFTMLLSRAVGADGRVLAFEAQAVNAHRLSGNVAANGCGNVAVHAVAVSDVCGELRFNEHSSSLEGALAFGGRSVLGAHDAIVMSTTIDTAVRAGAPPPNAMKIDVEGAEGSVIRGARETIAAHRPCMVMEMHSAAAWIEVLDALPLAYRFEDIDGAGRDPALHLPGHYLAVANG